MSQTTSPDLQQEEVWYERFDDSDDDHDYTQNLGADSSFLTSPGATASPGARFTPRSPPLAPNEVPGRQRIWRSLSFSRKKEALSANKTLKSRSASRQRSERECGICFSLAKKPARTTCCRSLFCHEHISDWLKAMPEGKGFCPTCNSPCWLAADVRRVSLSSSRNSQIHTPAKSPSRGSPSLPYTSPTLSFKTPGPQLPYASQSDAAFRPTLHSTDYDSDDSSSDYSSPDEHRSSWASGRAGILDSDPEDPVPNMVSKLSRPSLFSNSPAESELVGRAFTLMGLAIVLYLLLNGQSPSEKYNLGGH